MIEVFLFYIRKYLSTSQRERVGGEEREICESQNLEFGDRKKHI
jgi:hypothetical protein